MLFMLYAAFSSINTVSPEGATPEINIEAAQQIALECPEEVQEQCTNTLRVDLLRIAEAYHAEVSQRGAEAASNSKKTFHTRSIKHIPSKARLLLERQLLNLVTPFVCAVRVGAVDVKFAASMLAFYGRFDATFNGLCHELINVLRDDALHSGRAWIASETILEALKGVRARGLTTLMPVFRGVLDGSHGI